MQILLIESSWDDSSISLKLNDSHFQQGVGICDPIQLIHGTYYRAKLPNKRPVAKLRFYKRILGVRIRNAYSTFGKVITIRSVSICKLNLCWSSRRS